MKNIRSVEYNKGCFYGEWKDHSPIFSHIIWKRVQEYNTEVNYGKTFFSHEDACIAAKAERERELEERDWKSKIKYCGE